MLDTSNVKYRMNAAAGVVVRKNEDDGDEVLIIKRSSRDKWPNHWEFPRGKCDVKGEEIFGCLKREVKEEVGLDVKPIRLIDINKYTADKGERLTTCYNYLCYMKDPNQKVKLSHEHDDYKWIGEVGEAELILLPDQKKTIEKALNRDRSMVSSPGDKTMETVEEYLRFLQEEKEPCWKGYEMVGMKMKKGRKVPNCVPIKEEKENKPLNKPFRTPGGPKKFSVYVKNDKGNVVKVNFGDPNMEIKRDDPDRRKSFRARHNCANPGPKWKARYWSCYQWRSGAKVED